jgi:hypothetical protein
MLNTLARITRSLLNLKQYQDQAAQARLALEPMRDPRRKLTDDERRAIVAQVDEILGIKPLHVLRQEHCGVKTEAGGLKTEDPVVSCQSSVVSSQSSALDGSQPSTLNSQLA